MAAGILPTKDSITKFAPSSNQVCVLCNEVSESAVHIFWECPLSRAVWFGSVWGIRTDCIIINYASQLVELIITPPPEIIYKGLCEKKLCMFVALLLHQLWKCKNAIFHDKREVCVERIVSNIASLFSEHWSLRPESAISPPSIQVPKWQPPPIDYVKFNCDAAIGVLCSSIAVVAIDWRGTVVLALSKKVDTTIFLQAEAIAIGWATSIASFMGLEKIIFESDSQTSIDCLNSRSGSGAWRIAGLIQDIISLSAAHSCLSFSWVRRGANSAPHVLADWSLKHRF